MGKKTAESKAAAKKGKQAARVEDSGDSTSESEKAAKLAKLGKNVKVAKKKAKLRKPTEQENQEDFDMIIAQARTIKQKRWDARDWTRYKYAYLTDEDIQGPKCFENIDHIYVTSTTPDEFRAKYEDKAKPCMIHGCLNTWPAKDSWTPEALAERFGFDHFNSGPVNMRFNHYTQYCATTPDDAPIYLFETDYSDKFPELLEDYSVPEYFTDDLFHLVGENERPPYRWMIIGSKRTGTTIHVDPLGTAAWNALFCGVKRWVMFPPGTKRELIEFGHHPNQVSWFERAYPKLRKLAEEGGIEMMECMQRPGQTIFVPGGWWHIVMNMSFTVAVTQNFCSRSNLEYVWSKTIDRRPNFARHFYWKLPEHMRARLSLDGIDVDKDTDTDSPSSTILPTESSLSRSDLGWSGTESTWDSDEAEERRERYAAARAEHRDENASVEVATEEDIGEDE